MRASVMSVALSIVAVPLTAQAVRWTSQGIRYQAETVATDSAGRLVVTSSKSTPHFTIDPDTIPSLQRRVGGKHSRGQNALKWGLIGAAVGVVGGFASGDDPQGSWFAWTAEQKAAVGAATLGPIGAVIGLILPAARWIPYAGKQTARVQPVGGVHANGDPRLGVRIAF
jgi:hypothetical protein